LGLEKDRSSSPRDAGRVAALRRTGLLDGAPDGTLDRLTRLAARLLRCPTALLCLAADERLVVVSAFGAAEEVRGGLQPPIGETLCERPITSRSTVAVDDARSDERLRETPVATQSRIAGYAGVPLLDPEGRSLGALCVADTVPRHWTPAELSDLQDLAATATAELLRRLGETTAPADLAGQLSYDAVPVMIWTVTAEGSCDYVNARWLEFSGRALPSELGRGWADLIHSEDREAYLEQLRAALARREPMRLEYRARRWDGQYRWLLDVAVPSLAPDGELRGMIGCRTDVTDRHLLEQRVVRAERVQAIGQLAGGIAHDFNNLLTGILGHVSLLQEEPGLSAMGREDLSQIERSADRAATLTRQLLAFSRRQVLAPRVLDVNQLVAGCLSTLRRLVGDRVQIVWTPMPNLDPIVADPNQLEQVLTQLCAAARESMPAGGTVEIGTRQERLDAGATQRFSGMRPATYVILQVRDTGRGMDAQALERIFEPFFSPQGPTEGTGFGLAPVYGIVKQSGGHIEVASEPGRGTVYTMYFPRHEGSGPVGGGGPREPVGGSETILLVEDEEQVRDLARRVLERVGYTVLTANDAESATAIADRRGGHIHLLITDMMLPHLSGRELAARLSIHRPAIKVLYISGTSDPSIGRLRLLEPSVAFLEKPFSLDRLLRTVRQALDDSDKGGRQG
jgi:two-component system, cell cycle sensor histidine kinase and response regulator CckA